MKTNRINNIMWFAAILLLFGCNDDFLERVPLDSVSDATFWATESDLQVYNNNFYDLARNDDNVPIMMAFGILMKVPIISWQTTVGIIGIVLYVRASM